MMRILHLNTLTATCIFKEIYVRSRVQQYQAFSARCSHRYFSNASRSSDGLKNGLSFRLFATLRAMMQMVKKKSSIYTSSRTYLGLYTSSSTITHNHISTSISSSLFLIRSLDMRTSCLFDQSRRDTIARKRVNGSRKFPLRSE